MSSVTEINVAIRKRQNSVPAATCNAVETGLTCNLGVNTSCPPYLTLVLRRAYPSPGTGNGRIGEDPFLRAPFICGQISIEPEGRSLTSVRSYLRVAIEPDQRLPAVGRVRTPAWTGRSLAGIAGLAFLL